MTERYIITGGAGFIGSNLAHELVSRGEVHVVDNLYAGKREYVPSQAVFHKIDICDYDALEECFTSIGPVRAVFHLAALPRVQYSIEHPEESQRVNVTGTLHVLQAASKAKVGKCIYSASSSAYGDSDVLPLHEDLPTHPQSPYGLQKYIGELYMRLWSELYGIPTVSLRYFNVYGPRLDPEGSYALVVGRFLKLCQEGKPLTITGDGTQTRDFIHVRDVVQANILAMESSKAGKGEVINVGSGKNTSINDLAAIFGAPIQYITARPEPKHTRADNRRAIELLGWAPQVSLQEGIAELKNIFGIS